MQKFRYFVKLQVIITKVGCQIQRWEGYMNRYIFQSRRQNIAIEEYSLETSFTLSIQTNVLHILHTVVAAHFLQILKVVQKFYMQFSLQTKSRDQAPGP